MQSRPTWARGLKHQPFGGLSMVSEVAPHMGAWIETKLLAHYQL